MEEKTTKDYCNWLRALGKRLADGEIEEYRLSLDILASNHNGDDYYKITKSVSYSRTIINRVPEVKAAGTISIKVEETDDERFYVFRLNRDAKRKVLTSEDVSAIEQKAVAKAMRGLLHTMPNIADLSGEKAEGALIMAQRYQAIIENMIKGE